MYVSVLSMFTHTAVYATANLYVCAPNIRGGLEPKIVPHKNKKKNISRLRKLRN